MPILTLAAAHDGTEDHDTATWRHGLDFVHNLLDRLPSDLPAALWTVRMPDAGIQESEVVLHLGYSPNGRSGVMTRTLLVDADRRRQAVDVIDVGLVHLAKKLTRICGERLYIPPLSLGEDRVESKARLSRARNAGEDDQLAARDHQIDILEVVFAGAANMDIVAFQGNARPRRRIWEVEIQGRTNAIVPEVRTFVLVRPATPCFVRVLDLVTLRPPRDTVSHGMEVRSRPLDVLAAPRSTGDFLFSI